MNPQLHLARVRVKKQIARINNIASKNAEIDDMKKQIYG